MDSTSVYSEFPLKNQSNFQRSFSNGKAKATHTAAILLDHSIALLRWIGALGEEHAFVSSGFFVVAHAAGLLSVGGSDSCFFWGEDFLGDFFGGRSSRRQKNEFLGQRGGEGDARYLYCRG